MYPFYLGIDLHLKRTYMVLMNGAQEVRGSNPLAPTRCRDCKPATIFILCTVWTQWKQWTVL